jgi:hypothetical protein
MYYGMILALDIILAEEGSLSETLPMPGSALIQGYWCIESLSLGYWCIERDSLWDTPDARQGTDADVLNIHVNTKPITINMNTNTSRLM